MEVNADDLIADAVSALLQARKLLEQQLSEEAEAKYNDALVLKARAKNLNADVSALSRNLTAFGIMLADARFSSSLAPSVGHSVVHTQTSAAASSGPERTEQKTSTAPAVDSSTDIISLTKQLEDGLRSSNKPLLYSALKELDPLSLTAQVENPTYVLKRLLSILSADFAEGMDTRIKREIAVLAHRFLHRVYLVNQQQGQWIAKETQQGWLVTIRAVHDLVNKQVRHESAFRFELMSLKAGIQALQAGKPMDLISILSFLKEVYDAARVAITERNFEKMYALLERIFLQSLNYAKVKYEESWYRKVALLCQTSGVALEDSLVLEKLQQGLQISLKENNQDWQVVYAGVDVLQQVSLKGIDVTLKRQAFLGSSGKPGVVDFATYEDSQSWIQKKGWRVREKVAETAVLCLDHSDADISLAARKCRDQMLNVSGEDPRVRSTLLNLDYVQEVKKALSQNWTKERDQISQLGEDLKVQLSQTEDRLLQALRAKNMEHSEFYSHEWQSMVATLTKLTNDTQTVYSSLSTSAQEETNERAAFFEMTSTTLKKEIHKHSEQITSLLNQNRTVLTELSADTKKHLQELQASFSQGLRDQTSSQDEKFDALQQQLYQAQSIWTELSSNLQAQSRDFKLTISGLDELNTAQQEVRDMQRDLLSGQSLMLAQQEQLVRGQQVLLSGLEKVVDRVTERSPEEIGLAIKNKFFKFAQLQDLDMYIPERGALTSSSAADFDVDLEVNKMLNDPSKKVLLLSGGSGTGKSMYINHLAVRLWKDYDDGKRMVLHVLLPRVDQPSRDLMKKVLSDYYGVSQTEVKMLKEKSQPFFLLLDGYDEIFCTDNLYSCNQLYEWNVKVLITCRSQYLASIPNHFSVFGPQNSRTNQSAFQEIVLVPFNPEQIDQYLQRFAKRPNATWKEWRKYRSYIDSISGVRELIETAFILSMIVEVLPSIVLRHEREDSGELLRLARIDLYDAFADHWFREQESRLVENRSSGILHGKNIATEFKKFTRNLALKMYKLNIPVVRYSEDEKDCETWRAFFGNDAVTTVLRGGAPLRVLGECEYAFLHKSLLEYFAACETVAQVVADPSLTASSSETADVSKKILSADFDLNSALIKDPAILLFLVEMLNDDRFKQKLFGFIFQSRDDPNVSIASSNAMTILTAAGVSFSGMTLSGVRIRGADLSGGVFDEVDFSEADLTDVNFSQAWLRNVSFQDAQMTNVKFGESAYLKLQPNRKVVTSPDGSLLVAIDQAQHAGEVIALGNRSIVKRLVGVNGENHRFTSSHRLICESELGLQAWDVQTGKIVCSVVKDRLIYSRSGHQTLLVDEKGVHFWNPEQCSIITTLSIPPRLIDANCQAKFSPDGKHLLLLISTTANSAKKLIEFWEANTGAKLWEFKRERASEQHESSKRKGAHGKALESARTVATSAMVAKPVPDLEAKKAPKALSTSRRGSIIGRAKSVPHKDDKSRKKAKKGAQTKRKDRASIFATDFSADGKQLAVLFHDFEVVVIDTQTGAGSVVRRGDVALREEDLKVDLLKVAITKDPTEHLVLLEQLRIETPMTQADHKRVLGLTGQHFLQAFTSILQMPHFCVRVKTESLTFPPEIRSLLGRALSGETLDSEETEKLNLHILQAIYSREIKQKQETDRRSKARELLHFTYALGGIALTVVTKYFSGSVIKIQVQTFNAASGDAISVFQEVVSANEEANPVKLVFSPDGRTMLFSVFGYNGFTKVWDIEKGKHLFSLESYPCPGSEFFPDGKIVATLDPNGAIKLWNVNTQKCIAVLMGHTAPVSQLLFLEEGSKLVSYDQDGNVRLWDVRSWKSAALSEKQTGVVTSLDVSADEKNVASSIGNQVILWNSQTGRPQSINRVDFVNLKSVHFAKEDHALIARTKEGRVSRLNPALLITSSAIQLSERNQVVSNLIYLPSNICVVCRERFSKSNSKRTLVGADVVMLDISTGSEIQILRGHTDKITALTFGAGGQILATGSKDGTVRIWNTARGLCLDVLRGYFDQITCLAFSLSGRFLFTGTATGSLRCWNIENTFQSKNGVLTWSTNHPLFVEGVYLGGVKGLSAENLSIFEQNRGRKPVPATLESKYPSLIKRIVPARISYSKRGPTPMMRLFLNASINSITANLKRATELHEAVLSVNVSRLRHLLTQKLDVNARATNGMTPLHLAILIGRLDIVKLLTTHNANFDLIDFSGRGALDFALGSHDDTVIRFLIEQPSFDQLKQQSQLAALRHAVLLSLPRTVELLITRNQNLLHATDDLGQTVFDIARRAGEQTILKFLVSQGSKPENCSDRFASSATSASERFLTFERNNRTFLDAVRRGDSRALRRQLVTLDVKQVLDEKGNTPLHIVAESKHVEAARLLLNVGVDPRKRNLAGRTALELANDSKCPEIMSAFSEAIAAQTFYECVLRGDTEKVQKLLDQRTDPNQILPHQQTALHVAARNGYDDIVQILLESKAQSDILDRNGWKPIQYALSHLREHRGGSLHLNTNGKPFAQTPFAAKLERVLDNAERRRFEKIISLLEGNDHATLPAEQLLSFGHSASSVTNRRIFRRSGAAVKPKTSGKQKAPGRSVDTDINDSTSSNAITRRGALNRLKDQDLTSVAVPQLLQLLSAKNLPQDLKANVLAILSSKPRDSVLESLKARLKNCRKSERRVAFDLLTGDLAAFMSASVFFPYVSDSDSKIQNAAIAFLKSPKADWKDVDEKTLIEAFISTGASQNLEDILTSKGVDVLPLLLKCSTGLLQKPDADSAPLSHLLKPVVETLSRSPEADSKDAGQAQAKNEQQPMDDSKSQPMNALNTDSPLGIHIESAKADAVISTSSSLSNASSSASSSSSSLGSTFKATQLLPPQSKRKQVLSRSVSSVSKHSRPKQMDRRPSLQRSQSSLRPLPSASISRQQSSSGSSTAPAITRTASSSSAPAADAIPQLSRSSRSEAKRDTVLVAILLILSKIKDHRVLPVLEDAAQDYSKAVSNLAKHALARIRTANFSTLDRPSSRVSRQPHKSFLSSAKTAELKEPEAKYSNSEESERKDKMNLPHVRRSTSLSIGFMLQQAIQATLKQPSTALSQALDKALVGLNWQELGMECLVNALISQHLNDRAKRQLLRNQQALLRFSFSLASVSINLTSDLDLDRWLDLVHPIKSFVDVAEKVHYRRSLLFALIDVLKTMKLASCVVLEKFSSDPDRLVASKAQSSLQSIRRDYDRQVARDARFALSVRPILPANARSRSIFSPAKAHSTSAAHYESTFSTVLLRHVQKAFELSRRGPGSLTRSFRQGFATFWVDLSFPQLLQALTSENFRSHAVNVLLERKDTFLPFASRVACVALLSESEAELDSWIDRIGRAWNLGPKAPTSDGAEVKQSEEKIPEEAKSPHFNRKVQYRATILVTIINVLKRIGNAEACQILLDLTKDINRQIAAAAKAALVVKIEEEKRPRARPKVTRKGVISSKKPMEEAKDDKKSENNESDDDFEFVDSPDAFSSKIRGENDPVNPITIDHSQKPFELSFVEDSTKDYLAFSDNPLHVAAAFGDVLAVRQLVSDYRLNINQQDDQQTTALHQAVERGRFGVVQALLSFATVGLNLTDANGCTPLMLVSHRRGNLAIARLLVQRGALVNEANGVGDTALHFAIRENRSDIALFLLSAGAQNLPNAQGETPLHFAAAYHDVAVVETLLQRGESVNLKDRDNRCALHHAALNYNPSLAVAQLLLEHKADLTAQDIHGCTPLHCAVLGESEHLASFLLKNQSPCVGVNHSGSSVLHLAAEASMLDLIHELLQTPGVDIELKDKQGLTASDRAQRGVVKAKILNHGALSLYLPEQFEDAAKRRFLYHNHVVALLRAVDCGDEKAVAHEVQFVDVPRRFWPGEQSAFQRARSLGNPRVALQLISAVVDGKRYSDVPCWFAAVRFNHKLALLLLSVLPNLIHLRDDNGMTALHHAALCRQGLVVTALLNHNADISIQDDQGRTPLHCAVLAQDGFLADILARGNISLDLRDRKLRGLLHHAARLDLRSFMFHLVSEDVDIEQKDGKGKTPLDYAVWSGNLQTVQYLLAQDAQISNKSCCTKFATIRASLRYERHKRALLRAMDASDLETVERELPFLDARRVRFPNSDSLLSRAVDLENRAIALQLLALNVEGKIFSGMAAWFKVVQSNFKLVLELLGVYPFLAHVSDEHGMSSLHHAALSRQRQVVQILLRCNADVHVMDTDGRTPMRCAILASDASIAELLLSYRASFDHTDLCIAAKIGSLELLNLFLKYGLGFDLNSQEGCDALDEAALAGNLSAVLLLLGYGARISLRALESKDDGVRRLLKVECHRRNLLTAVQEGNAQVIAAEIRYVDIRTVRNADGHSLFRMALRHQNPYIALQLVSIPVNGRLVTGPAAWFACVSSGALHLVQSLLQIPNVLSVKDENGMNALHSAVLHRQWHVLRALMLSGLLTSEHIGAQDFRARTPLHFAVIGGDESIARYLLRHKAPIDIRDSDGSTALHYSAERGALTFVKILVEFGADVALQDGEGRTALDLAVRATNVSLVSYLMSCGACLTQEPSSMATAPECVRPMLIYEMRKRSLLKAVDEGDVETFRTCLSHLDARQIFYANGDSLLQRAVQRRHLNLVEILLAHDIDLDHYNLQGLTVFDNAKVTFNGQIDQLLQIQVRKTSFYRWVSKGNALQVIEMLKAGFDPNERLRFGQTALSIAVRRDFVDVVRALLAHKAEPAIRDRNGWSAYQHALHHLSTPMLELLGLRPRLDKPRSDPHSRALEQSNEEAFKLVGSNRFLEIEYLPGLFPQERWANEKMPPIVKGDGRTSILAFLHSLNSSTIHDSNQSRLERLKRILLQAVDAEEVAIIHKVLKFVNPDEIKYPDGQTLQQRAISNGHPAVFLAVFRGKIDGKRFGGIHAWFAAIRSSNWQVAKTLLKYGAVINVADETGLTALHIAAHLGNVPMVKLLKYKQADITKRDAQGRTALDLAIINRDAAVIRLLSPKPQRSSFRKMRIIAGGQTTIVISREVKETSETKEEKERSEASETKDTIKKETPGQCLVSLLPPPAAPKLDFEEEDLHPSRWFSSAQAGNYKLVRAFLRTMEVCNSQDENGMTALHHAALNKEWTVVKELLNHDANVSIRDVFGRMALNCVILGESEAYARVIITRGAPCDVADYQGLTLLHYAAKTGLLGVVELLLEKQCIDINQVDKSGCTALDYAALGDDERLVQALLRAGASISDRALGGEDSYLHSLLQKKAGKVDKKSRAEADIRLFADLADLQAESKRTVLKLSFRKEVVEHAPRLLREAREAQEQLQSAIAWVIPEKGDSLALSPLLLFAFYLFQYHPLQVKEAEDAMKAQVEEKDVHAPSAQERTLLNVTCLLDTRPLEFFISSFRWAVNALSQIISRPMEQGYFQWPPAVRHTLRDLKVAHQKTVNFIKRVSAHLARMKLLREAPQEVEVGYLCKVAEIYRQAADMLQTWPQVEILAKKLRQRFARLEKKRGALDAEDINGISLRHASKKDIDLRRAGLLGTRQVLFVLLGDLMSNSTQPMRLAAIKTLRLCGDPQVLHALRRFVVDNDVEIRAEATRALSKFNREDAVGYLLRALYDEESVCVVAIEQLVILKEPSALKHFRFFSKDASRPKVQAEAVKALKSFEPTLAGVAMMYAAMDDDQQQQPRVRRRAHRVQTPRSRSRARPKSKPAPSTSSSKPTAS